MVVAHSHINEHLISGHTRISTTNVAHSIRLVDLQAGNADAVSMNHSHCALPTPFSCPDTNIAYQLNTTDKQWDDAFEDDIAEQQNEKDEEEDEQEQSDDEEDQDEEEDEEDDQVHRRY